MKKNIYSIVMHTMCGTLTSVLGIQMITKVTIGFNADCILALLLLLVAATFAALVGVSISELLGAIRIAELDAGLKQIHNLQKMQTEIYGQSNA